MSDSVVKYRGIIHERTEDAPFMGALILSISCKNNCRNCFNQHLKKSQIYYKFADELIAEVRQNKFNEGIILAGLEWSEQPMDAMHLIYDAKLVGLKVMLYTGLNEQELYKRIPKEVLVGCYVKFGPYQETHASDNYKSLGVRLASTNQYIKIVQS